MNRAAVFAVLVAAVALISTLTAATAVNAQGAGWARISHVYDGQNWVEFADGMAAIPSGAPIMLWGQSGSIQSVQVTLGGMQVGTNEVATDGTFVKEHEPLADGVYEVVVRNCGDVTGPGTGICTTDGHSGDYAVLFTGTLRVGEPGRQGETAGAPHTDTSTGDVSGLEDRIQSLEADNKSLKDKIRSLEDVISKLIERIDAITTLVQADVDQDEPQTSMVIIKPMSNSSTKGCQNTEEGCYNYPVLTVEPGTEIIFRNTDSVAHTLTSGTTANRSSDTIDSGFVPAGASYEFTLDEEGIYDYNCLIHSWMTGQIVVGNPSPSTTASTHTERITQQEEYYIRNLSSPTHYTAGDKIHFEAKLPPCSRPTYGIDGETVISVGGDTRILISELDSDGRPINSAFIAGANCYEKPRIHMQNNVSQNDYHTAPIGYFIVYGSMTEGTYALRAIADRDGAYRTDVFTQPFVLVPKS